MKLVDDLGVHVLDATNEPRGPKIELAESCRRIDVFDLAHDCIDTVAVEHTTLEGIIARDDEGAAHVLVDVALDDGRSGRDDSALLETGTVIGCNGRSERG